MYDNYRASDFPALDPILSEAAIMAEDHRHFHHRGVDIVALGRAAWCCIFKSSLQGGSTIEQQLVRTITGRYERTLRRKIREVFLATFVESVIPKEEVVPIYLSIAYFGARMNGLEQALTYLGLSKVKLSPRDAASIIARLKYPEPALLSPKRQDQIRTRTEHILRLMRESSSRQLVQSPSISNGIDPDQLFAASTSA
jgi:membrane peptidoglycan carboxypeptidase